MANGQVCSDCPNNSYGRDSLTGLGGTRVRQMRHLSEKFEVLLLPVSLHLNLGPGHLTHPLPIPALLF